MKPEIRVRSKSYKDGLLRYETIVTAFVFLTIYDHTTPLSNYLQTSGLDVLKAFQFVQNVIKKLQDLRSNFVYIKQKADDFVRWAQTKLSERDVEAEIETELPTKRVRIRKKMPGEQSYNEIVENPDEAFKVQVYFVVVDTIVTSLKRRFDSASQRFFADLSLLDPKNFTEIKGANEMSPQVFEELSKKLLKFDDKATPENIRKELISLADNWDTIKKSSLEAYSIEEQQEVLDEEEGFVEEEENDLISSTKLCNSCQNCCICCYRLLQRYNLLTGSYSSLGLAYKYLLTLSFTQVACERSFSILKYLKSRLRSNLGQSKLESFMLMSSEKEILMKLDVNSIIDKVADKSKLMQSLLKY